MKASWLVGWFWEGKCQALIQIGIWCAPRSLWPGSVQYTVKSRAHQREEFRGVHMISPYSPTIYIFVRMEGAVLLLAPPVLGSYWRPCIVNSGNWRFWLLKLRVFWRGHKIWKKSSSCFWQVVFLVKIFNFWALFWIFLFFLFFSCDQIWI